MKLSSKIKSFFAILFIMMLCACASGQKTVWEGEPKSEAEAAYRKAVKSLETGAYEESIKSFNALKLSFPYATRWATLADLRIADAYYESGEFAVAAVSYQDFVKTFPTHVDIPYAMFKIARCYDNLMPSEFFILPDSWQRERKTVVQAATAYKTFLSKYPENENAPEAQERLKQIQYRLINHELYVAEYYFKQESYIGSINRLKNLIKDYPKSDLTPKALILLAHAYLKILDPIAAKQTLNALIRDFPDAEQTAQAREWIERNSEVPDNWEEN